MLNLDERNRQWELSLASEELNEFHDSCDLRDDENGLLEEPVDSEDESLLYLFGKMENAEVVQDAYGFVDLEDF